MNLEKGFMISIITGWNVSHQCLHQKMYEEAFKKKKNSQLDIKLLRFAAKLKLHKSGTGCL